MKVVIAEKPSVAQSLSRVIGANKRQDGCLEGELIFRWFTTRPDVRNPLSGCGSPAWKTRPSGKALRS